jgi:hypothetical protein
MVRLWNKLACNVLFRLWQIWLLEHVSYLDIAECKQPCRAPFATKTRLLVATKNSLRSDSFAAVDENTPSLNLVCNLSCPRYICRPHTCGESGRGIIGRGDDCALI